MFFRTKHIRMRYVLLFIGIILLLIILKVFYIQVFQYNKLNDLATDLWSRNLPITADRGLILDRNGKVLAQNITTTSLVLIPNQIKDKEKVAKDLSDILICPDLKSFNSLKINGKNDMIKEGYRATIEQMPKIEKLFTGKIKPKKCNLNKRKN